MVSLRLFCVEGVTVKDWLRNSHRRLALSRDKWTRPRSHRSKTGAPPLVCRHYIHRLPLREIAWVHSSIHHLVFPVSTSLSLIHYRNTFNCDFFRYIYGVGSLVEEIFLVNALVCHAPWLPRKSYRTSRQGTLTLLSYFCILLIFVKGSTHYCYENTNVESYIYKEVCVCEVLCGDTCRNVRLVLYHSLPSFNR